MTTSICGFCAFLWLDYGRGGVDEETIYECVNINTAALDGVV
jgi:hypothetical protein